MLNKKSVKQPVRVRSRARSQPLRVVVVPSDPDSVPVDTDRLIRLLGDIMRKSASEEGDKPLDPKNDSNES